MSLEFFFGQVFKLGATLDLRISFLALVLALDQDVPRAIFGAGRLRLDLVVLGLVLRRR